MAAATAGLRGPCRVHVHRFKQATIELFVLPPPLTHPYGPLPSPSSVTPPATCPVCVSCCTRSTCPLLVLPLEVVVRVLRVLRVLRVRPLLPLLLRLKLLLVCCVFYSVSLLNNLLL